MQVIHNGKTINFTITAKNVHIDDSYKIKSRSDMTAICNLIRAEAKKKKFTYKRSVSSWVTEWRAHNYMYDRNIERNRTADVDLNENEGRLKLLSYSVMSAKYKG